MIYFKSNLISEKNIELFTKNPTDLVEKYPGVNEKFILTNIYSKENPINFDENVDSDLWLILLNEILNYRKNFTQKMSELIHKGLIADAKKLGLEFQKWQIENPNKSFIRTCIKK